RRGRAGGDAACRDRGARREGRHGHACGRDARGRPAAHGAGGCPRPLVGPGLFGTYYATMDWSGSPLAAFVTPTIDSDGVLPPGAHSARWTGTLVPQR